MTHLFENIKKPTFIDLFAGIGGFRQAFEQADYQCVFSCEIDKSCQQVYNANFGELPHGDITQIQDNQLPDFDVLLAGFPCQPYRNWWFCMDIRSIIPMQI